LLLAAIHSLLGAIHSTLHVLLFGLGDLLQRLAGVHDDFEDSGFGLSPSGQML